MASGLPLSLILDRPIAFHAALARVAGSVKVGLVLGQAIYWQNRYRSGDGWWWKTQKQWTDETGLGNTSACCRKRRRWMRIVMEWLNKPMTMDDMAIILFVISVVLFGVTYYATMSKGKRK